jgi:hypothetical protein
VEVYCDVVKSLPLCRRSSAIPARGQLLSEASLPLCLARPFLVSPVCLRLFQLPFAAVMEQHSSRPDVW